MATEKPHRVTAITFEPTKLYGGYQAKCSIKLNRLVPAGGIRVALSSNSRYVVVPSSVTVPGGQRMVTFTVKTKVVKKNKRATIEAVPNDGLAKHKSVIVFDTSKVPVIKSDQSSYPTGSLAYVNSYWLSPPVTGQTFNFTYSSATMGKGPWHPSGNPMPPFTAAPGQPGNQSQVSIDLGGVAPGTYQVTAQCVVLDGNGQPVTGSPFSSPQPLSIVVNALGKKP